MTNEKQPGDAPAQRKESPLSPAGDPYCFRVGNTPVRVSFREDGKPLEQALTRYFISLKK